LLAAIRERLPFAEVPIKLYLRRRQVGDYRDETGKGEGGKQKHA
jgi:hypothetical protein